MAQVLAFANFSPARFTAVQDELGKRGLFLSGDQGQIKKFGADVFYVYADNILTLTVESAPHFHSMNSFCDEIKKAIDGVTG